MPFDATPPTVIDELARLASRIDALERVGGPRAATQLVEYTATAFPSRPWSPPCAIRYHRIKATAGGAVAADTTFEVQRNGITIATVTVAAGDNRGVAEMDPVTVDVGDIITTVRTAGSDVATVQLAGTSQHPITPTVGGAGNLPHSACGLIYSGDVDSYTETAVTDVSSWSSSFVLALADVVVHNNTGSAGYVELDGFFRVNGGDVSGASNTLLAMTLGDGDKVALHHHCTIERGSSNGYRVANLGATNVAVTATATFVEVDAPAACCTGGA